MFPHQTSVHLQTASRLEMLSFLTQSSSPSAAPSSFPRNHADLAIVVPPSASGLHVKLSVEAVKRGDTPTPTPTPPQPSFPRSSINTMIVGYLECTCASEGRKVRLWVASLTKPRVQSVQKENSDLHNPNPLFLLLFLC